MRVYHLLSSEFAIKNLKNQRLKICRFDECNDPFELLGVELSKPDNREKFRDLKKDINEKKGILCFSRSWRNPVLWSHYGDKHKGICLGFDIPDKLLKKVVYVKKRLSSNVEKELDKETIDENLQEKIFTTKFEHWKYEDEERVIVPLDEAEKKDNLYFKKFNSNLQIKEVIVGAQCQTQEVELKEITKDISSGIKIIKARLAFTKFGIVIQRKGFGNKTEIC